MIRDWTMDVGEFLPPLPLEPPDADGSGNGKCKAPPPPPLQTSSDAEEMDVSSGGDGPALTPAEDRDQGVPLLTKGSVSFSSRRCKADDHCSPGASCPRTARHAPPVTKFLPDLKLLRDVKISVSFGGDSSKSKDRKVLYTGAGQIGEQDLENGQVHDSLEQGAGQAGAGGLDRKSEEHDADLENKVEFAVLDELEDFTENFLEADESVQSEFTSEMIVQQEPANEEDLSYSYEVRPQRTTPSYSSLTGKF